MNKPKDTASLGMWIFLGSELLFFGGLFLSLAVYRHVYADVFAQGTRLLSLTIGSINTAVLLTSSLVVALALESAKKRKLFALTFILGCIFLFLKAYEYDSHYREGLFPVFNWGPQYAESPRLKLFFVLYFIVTGLHALHIIIGLSLFGWVIVRNEKNDNFLHNIGLYWHFVDIIWVFIFPMLYLFGRNP